MRIAVTSKKDIKLNAVRSALLKNKKNVELVGFSTEADMAEQPIDQQDYSFGMMGAILRIQYLLNYPDFDKRKFNYIISMENSIHAVTEEEISNVAIYNIKTGKINTAKCAVKTNKKSITKFLKEAKELTKTDYKYRMYGYEITIGKLINKKYPKIPDSDWLIHYGSISRGIQLVKSLEKLKKYLK